MAIFHMGNVNLMWVLCFYFGWHMRDVAICFCDRSCWREFKLEAAWVFHSEGVADYDGLRIIQVYNMDVMIRITD